MPGNTITINACTYIATMIAAMLLFTILDKIVIDLGAAAVLNSTGTKYSVRNDNGIESLKSSNDIDSTSISLSFLSLGILYSHIMNLLQCMLAIFIYSLIYIFLCLYIINDLVSIEGLN